MRLTYGITYRMHMLVVDIVNMAMVVLEKFMDMRMFMAL
jgi:hypothetical protein